MAAVAVNEDVLKMLQVFGDVNEQINTAVEEYAARRIIERIKTARAKLSEFEKTYGIGFAAFSERMGSDEAFYAEVNRVNPLWEQDALTWEYWQEEAQEWSNSLNTILNKS